MSEDIPMRDQRADLRKKGYRFSTDQDYLIGYKQTVDITTDNLIPPPEIRNGKTFTFTFSELERSKSVRVSNGINELILSSNGEQISVFPGYCPHEGAALHISSPHGHTVTCPWHGRACKPLLVFNRQEVRSGKSFQKDQFDIQIQEEKLILNL